MLKRILQLETKLESQQSQLSQYYEYYKGNHKAVNQDSVRSKKDNQEVVNFCKLFIDNNTGFLLGNSVQLKYVNTEEDNIVDIYHDALGAKVQQLDQKLMRDIQIFGYAYEINYINKQGEFDLAIKTPLDVAVNRVGNKVVDALLYQGTVGDTEVYDYFDVTGNMVYRLEKQNGKFETKQKVSNPLNNPVIVVYNNWEQQSEMKDIMSLNDSYNQVSSDATGEIHDFRNAYLYFKGLTVTDDVITRMNKSGIITSPGKSSSEDVKFITKDLNSDFIDKKLSQLESKIYDLAGQVNFNDKGIGSNTSSLALRNKLTNLINKLKLKEGFLREAMLIRLKNLQDYIETSTTQISDRELDEFFNPAKVDVSFIMNIPTSDKETAEMVIELHNAGLLSRESAISQLSFINVVRDELDKIERDEQDNIDLDSILKLIELEDDADETIR